MHGTVHGFSAVAGSLPVSNGLISRSYLLSSVTQFLWCSQITLEAVGQLGLSEHSCSCAAGKGFCSHITALLFQTAHYVQLGLDVVPPSLACTSQPQMWHRPRTHVCCCVLCSNHTLQYLSRVYEHFLYCCSPQGIHPEAVSDLVVKKPKSVGKTGVKSTLYRAYAGKTFVLQFALC